MCIQEATLILEKKKKLSSVKRIKIEKLTELPMTLMKISQVMTPELMFVAHQNAQKKDKKKEVK